MPDLSPSNTGPAKLDPVTQTLLDMTTFTPAQLLQIRKQRIINDPRNSFRPPPSIRTAKLDFNNIPPERRYEMAKSIIPSASPAAPSPMPEGAPARPAPAGPNNIAQPAVDPTKIIHALASAAQKLLAGGV